MIARRLTAFEVWPCASPGYLSGHPPIRRPADLLGHRNISHADRRETWRFRTAAGGVQDVQVEPGVVIPEPDVLKTMLMAGAGVGLLPDFHALDAIRDGRLIRLLPDLEGSSVEAHALYPSHRSLSGKVRVFVDALVEHLGAARSHPGHAPMKAADEYQATSPKTG